MSRAIVLLSAGLDSVVSFKIAFDTFNEIRCLTFDYAQKANRTEIEYAAKICALYDVDHQIIRLPWYASFIGALTSQKIPPRVSDLALDDLAATRETASAVWVPARNAVFLSIAAAFCENFAFNAIVVGFNKEERSRGVSICYRCAVFRLPKMFGFDFNMSTRHDAIVNLRFLKLTSIEDKYCTR